MKEIDGSIIAVDGELISCELYGKDIINYVRIDSSMFHEVRIGLPFTLLLSEGKVVVMSRTIKNKDNDLELYEIDEIIKDL